ncbi:hypothetical protein ACLMJK_002440 [Lecanora helva]
MPSLNFLRRKSTKVDRTSNTSSSSKSIKPSSQMGSKNSPFGSFSAPTRRPANPATVANPFASSSDAPPAYSGPAPEYSAPAPNVAPSTDSQYAFLTTIDTVFLIDDSGSMAGRSWRETKDALSAITPICTSHDKDGIDIHFLNAPDSDSYLNITNAEQVQRIFNTVKPSGGTPTGTKLNRLLRPYLRELEMRKHNIDQIKPLNIIVITDGVPTDDEESVIIHVAKKLDKLEAPPWQVGIQFFQVGEEAGAAEHLRELDDSLKETGDGCRDIVDTVPWNGASGTGLNADGILKVVLGAVNKRLDRKRVSLDGRPTGSS